MVLHEMYDNDAVLGLSGLLRGKEGCLHGSDRSGDRSQHRHKYGFCIVRIALLLLQGCQGCCRAKMATRMVLTGAGITANTGTTMRSASYV